MNSFKKSIIIVMLIGSMAAVFFSGCKKEQKTSLAKLSVTKTDSIPSQIIAKIKAAGFNTNGILKKKEGYLVEGDIILTDAFLNSDYVKSKLVIGSNAQGPRFAVDQYSVTNPINPNHSVFTIYKVFVSGLGANYSTATDEALARYNSANLCIQFVRITTGTPDITITGYSDNSQTAYQAYAGFPVNGVIYNSINMNTYKLGTNPSNILFTASIIQHEIGHCIGMRHTDYSNTAYSCNGPVNNEGAGTAGAVQIPGTPSTPDALSWMLACNDNVSNRTFNANDLVALNYLFPHITINGAGSYNWFNGNGSGSGTINANPGVIVRVTVSAYGPGTTTYFMLNGAPLNGAPAGFVSNQNKSTDNTFVMPSSGSVQWNGTFSRTGSSGTGDIAVN